VSDCYINILTLILLTWSIGWAPNNASKWQMGLNFAFKGLNSANNLGFSSDELVVSVLLASGSVVLGTYLPTLRDSSGLIFKDWYVQGDWIFRTLKMSTLLRLETSGTNNPAPRRHVQNNGDHVQETLSEDTPPPVAITAVLAVVTRLRLYELTAKVAAQTSSVQSTYKDLTTRSKLHSSFLCIYFFWRG
jgi:hypothetical protein